LGGVYSKYDRMAGFITMATTTPNYGWPVPTSTDFVKDGATAIEALGDAIDATVFGLPGGLTLVNTTTFSSVASQSLNNVFTSTYQNYVINIDAIQNTSAANIGLRFRVGGADNTSGSYFYMITGLNTAPAADNLNAALQTSSLFTRGFTGARFSANMNFFNPAVATTSTFTTIGNGASAGGQAASFTGAGLLSANTAFDGITFITSANTMTGTIRVYGYNN